jgi:uncharacterized Zn finger protein
MSFEWKPYVPVAVRRNKAAKELAKLAKGGRKLEPVVIPGRTIATTFWGTAWNGNLEAYSDFDNRLPRGRTYARNGSVLDLQIGDGEVTALVSGSEIYQIHIKVAPVAKEAWGSICRDCAGGIESLVELLQGRLSKGVMERICRQKTGLFPSPKDITFSCSCPDWASMCKHVAAVLYGVGARLDHRPELLFTLRQVTVQDLLASAGQGTPLSHAGPARDRILEDDIADLFDLEMAEPFPARTGSAPAAPPPRKPAKGKAPAKPAAKPVARKVPKPAPKPAAKAAKKVVEQQHPRAAPKTPARPAPTAGTRAGAKPYDRLRGIPDESVDAVAFARNSIAKDLRAMRKAAGLTQVELSKRVKKSQAFVSGAERGTSRVGEHYLLAVVRACGLPEDWKG